MTETSLAHLMRLSQKSLCRYPVSGVVEPARGGQPLASECDRRPS